MTSAATLAGVRPVRVPVAIRLTEWATLAPGPEGQARVLQGLSFDEAPQARAEARKLAQAGVVSVIEMRDGLHVESGSFVGRLHLGPLDITIEPKVSWGRWLTLVAYGMRLRGLTRAEHLPFATAHVALHDLIVMEMLSEARDLIGRGLHREYVRRQKTLAAPRGRIDFARLAMRGGIHEAALPCRYTQRSDNSPLNQALLAGLRLATRIALDIHLRADAHRLVRDLEQTVSVPIDTVAALAAAERVMDRRTVRYAPAMRLIALLLEGTSVSLEDGDVMENVSLPGFAIDMNRLWQHVLARVLGEWADGVEVKEEFGLRGLFQRNAAFPFRRQVPTPRPDFAVFRQGRLQTFLDAKYRDLWATKLPREMLYQLALYAMAQGKGAVAMLYPTDAPDAVEQRLDIRDPATSAVRASVALRPVPLSALETLIASPLTSARSTARRAFAQRLMAL